ncbi:FUSC family protein, partial [Casaltella massiliensis]|nr:FUSC family protein [Casaltella massiliensis]
MKFTYATKVAIGIALGGFIMDYFNLKEGRWILYTIFSVIQPYTEDGIIKTKKRLFGTILGCISVFILFSI